MSGDGLRLDKWLWHARFYKSRTLATAACQARIRINGVPVGKSHQQVKPGDIITFAHGSHIRIVRVLALGTRRGPATEARLLYQDLAPPAAPQACDEQTAATSAGTSNAEAANRTSRSPRDRDVDDPSHRPA